jgi:hypothetical protein
MIFVTHFFDRLSKFFLIVMMCLLVGLLTEFFYDSISEPLFYLISIALCIFVCFPVHHRTFDVLSTRLFVRSKFKVWASWSESANMRVLFCPSLLYYIKNDLKYSRNAKQHSKQKYIGKFPRWYPMDEVLKLPLEQRLPELLRTAQLVIERNKSF